MVLLKKTKRPIVIFKELMKVFSYFFAQSKIAQNRAKINFLEFANKTMGRIKFLMPYLVLEDQKLVMCHSSR